MKMYSRQNTPINFTLLFSLSLVIVLFSAGCNIMRLSSQYDKTIDFKSYKTYTITQSILSLRMKADNKELLEMAITREMNARGYQKSNSVNTDLWIDLYIKFDKSTDVTQSYEAPIGLYPYAYSFGFGTVTTNYHECVDGTLFMNIIDTKKKEIVWTGRISTGIDEDQTEKEIEQLINKVVKKIFTKYPVSI